MSIMSWLSALQLLSAEGIDQTSLQHYFCAFAASSAMFSVKHVIIPSTAEPSGKEQKL